MDDKPKKVPYFAYESMLVKDDRQHKRMLGVIIGQMIVIIILIIMLVLSNLYWVYQWSQYDYVDEYEVEVDSEGEGNANYIGEDGDIYNGTSESNKTQTKST